MLHILLADDHGIVRSGLRVLIERQDGMTVELTLPARGMRVAA